MDAYNEWTSCEFYGHQFKASDDGIGRTCTDCGDREETDVMDVYSFDMTVSTHDLLQRGIVAGRLHGSQYRHHRIVVVAESRNEAALTACQMASCHGMATGCYDRI